MTSAALFSVRVFSIAVWDIPGKDRSGTSDPYVKINFDNFKELETETIDKTTRANFALY